MLVHQSRSIGSVLTGVSDGQIRDALRPAHVGGLFESVPLQAVGYGRLLRLRRLIHDHGVVVAIRVWPLLPLLSVVSTVAHSQGEVLRLRLIVRLLPTGQTGVH